MVPVKLNFPIRVTRNVKINAVTAKTVIVRVIRSKEMTGMNDIARATEGKNRLISNNRPDQ